MVADGIAGIGTRLFRARSQLRADRGVPVTQETIGEAIGVTGGQIGHWEKGRQLPDLEMVQRLARTLEVSEVWLIHGIGPMAREGAAESDDEFQRRTGLSVRVAKPTAELTRAVRTKKPATQKEGGRKPTKKPRRAS